MGIYFISSNKTQALKAQDELMRLFAGQAELYDMGKLYAVLTSAFRTKCTKHIFEECCVYVLGTIFNEKGFNEDVLNSYEDCVAFIADLKSKEQVMFGHYVVLVLRQGGEAEIIPDRIGLINTYYAKDKNDDVYISNDVLLVSKLSANYNLHWQSVYEFLLTESNVGRNTVFKNVFRLKLGNELLINKNKVKEENAYSYDIEKLEKEKYLEKIKFYFDCFNNYRKKIAIDISAGYDTRLVASIAGKQIKLAGAVTVENRNDKGVDQEISALIADELKLQLNFLQLRGTSDTSENVELVLHGASVLRDANRSNKFPYLFKEKYQFCDLALGGYGGEVIRAKYQKYSGIEDYVDDYFKANEAGKICGFKNYKANVLEELEDYPVPNGLNEKSSIQNWYYAVSKMRIWGSGFIQMSCLYGEVIHPFMDWYLLGPLFGFKYEELKDAQFQKELIETFSPGLMDIPINAHIGQKQKFSIKGRLVKYCQNRKALRDRGTILYCLLRNLKEYKKTDFDNSLDGSNDMEIIRIMNKMGKRVRSRMRSILAAYEYSKVG